MAVGTTELETVIVHIEDESYYLNLFKSAVPKLSKAPLHQFTNLAEAEAFMLSYKGKIVLLSDGDYPPSIGQGKTEGICQKALQTAYSTGRCLGSIVITGNDGNKERVSSEFPSTKFLMKPDEKTLTTLKELFAECGISRSATHTTAVAHHGQPGSASANEVAADTTHANRVAGRTKREIAEEHFGPKNWAHLVDGNPHTKTPDGRQ